MGRLALSAFVAAFACMCPGTVAHPSYLSCSDLNKAKTNVMYQTPTQNGAAPTAEADGTTYIPGKTYTLSGSVPGSSKKILVSGGANGCCNNNGCSWTAPGSGAVEIVQVGASSSSGGVWYATRTVNPPPPTCPAGQGGTHPSCAACPAGQFKAAAANAACDACSPGQAQPATGQASCAACGAGRFQSSDGQSSCAACAPGKYRDGTAAASAAESVACKACPSGEFQAQPAQTACAACAPGKYRDAANAAASSGETSACKACPVDTSQPSAGQTACEACAAGRHTDAATGRASCISLPGQACSLGCDAGAYCKPAAEISGSSVDLCQSCPAGRFQATAHTGTIEFCNACATGEYQDQSGKPACVKCAAGQYRDTAEAASSAAPAACKSCARGMHQDLDAQTACKGEACAAGKFFALQAQTAPVTCTECAPGQYQDAVGQADCKGTACAAGKFGEAGATAVSAASCGDCIVGRFAGGTGATQCLACPGGRNQPLPGQSSCVIEASKPHKTSIEFTLASNVIGAASDNLSLAPGGSNTVHFSHGSGTAFANHGPDNRGTALVTWRTAGSCATPAATGDTTAGGQAWDCEVALDNGASRVGVLAYRFDASGSATFRYTVQEKAWAAFGFKKAQDPAMKGWAVVAKYASSGRRQLAGAAPAAPTAKPYAMTGTPPAGASINTMMTELSAADAGLSAAPVVDFVEGDAAPPPAPTPAPAPSLGGGKIAWRFDAAGGSGPRSADLRFTAAPGVDGWFAFGFTGGSGAMVDSWAAAVGAQPGGGGMRTVTQFALKAYSRSSFVALGREDGDVQTAYAKDGSQHYMHIHIADVTNISASLGTALGKTLLDPDGTTEILYASHGSNAAFASRHDSRSTATVNWSGRAGGVVKGTSFFGGKGFQGEITLGKSKDIDGMIEAHGLLMMLSWGWLLPMGVVIARYCKSWAPDGIWYRLHRAIQSVGLVLAVIAFAIIVAAYDDVGAKHFGGPNKSHEQLGLAVMVIGLLQPLNAFIKRPHPPKPGETKTTARFVWELVHKNLGRLGIACGIVNVAYGLTLSRVDRFPNLERGVLIIIWLAVVVLSAVVVSFEHSCRDRNKGGGGVQDINDARDSARANAAKGAAESAEVGGASDQVFNTGNKPHRIV